MSCREVARVAASEHEANLGVGGRIAVRLHALACPHCRRYVRELKAIGQAAREMSRTELDATRVRLLEQAVLSRLRSELPDA